jgi:beta-glucosidase
LLKAMEAGVDSFGGEECPDLIIALVESGRCLEARNRRLGAPPLREKFRWGCSIALRGRRGRRGSGGLGCGQAAGLDASDDRCVLLKNEVPRRRAVAGAGAPAGLC